MKNWKTIFAAVAAVSAASIASAQDATDTTKTTTTSVATDGMTASETVVTQSGGDSSETLELKTKNGVIVAKKIVKNGKTRVMITASGIQSQAGIDAIMADIKRAGDLLDGKTPVPASNPSSDVSDGIKGKYSVIVANKEISNGKLSIRADVHSIPADITAADLAEDFLSAISQMVVDHQISLAGKTVALDVAFAPGENPVVNFSVGVSSQGGESWGSAASSEQPDNSVNLDEKSITPQ